MLAGCPWKGVEPLAHRGGGFVEAAESVIHKIVRTGVSQLWIVAQAAVDLGDFKGSEQRPGDALVFVLQKLYPLQAQLVDRLGIEVQGRVATDHVPVNRVPTGEVAEPGPVLGAPGGKGHVSQCDPKAGQAGTHAGLDRLDQGGTASVRPRSAEFGGRRLGGDRVVFHRPGEDLIEFTEGLANVQGEGHYPGGGALTEPGGQLIDHLGETTQLLQIPPSVFSGDQRLEVKRRKQRCQQPRL